MPDQLTLNFKAGYTESYNSCRELVQARVHLQGRPQKSIAMDMDYAPSQLTRKLAQADNSRFTLDDLELFIEVTEDFTPIHYLIERHILGGDKEQRIQELERQIEQLRSTSTGL